MHPPKAKKVPHQFTEHGNTRQDPYYWMREKENPEVIRYLEAENEYTRAMLSHTEGLQEELFEEIKGRIKKDDQSVPVRLKDFYYYHRFEADKEYPIYCRKQNSMESPEEIILDVNVLAQRESYCRVAAVKMSENHRFMAYAIDTLGRRIYNICIKDLSTGELLDDKLEHTTANFAWAEDNKTLFYARQDAETLRSDKIYRHTLGTSASDDQLVYSEEDDTFGCRVGKTKSREYILFVSGSTLSTEVWYLDARNPVSDPTLFSKREKKHEYSIDHHRDYFWIISNDQAQNFRLLKTRPEDTAKESWEEVIPHRKQVLLEDVELFDDFLVLEERENGLTHIRIRDYAGEKDHYLKFDDPSYLAYIDNNPNADTVKLRFAYQSLTTPPSVFEYDMNTGERSLLKEQAIMGGFDKHNYVSERVFAISKDGTKIPVSLVYRKGINRTGENPLLLYGYGSYGISMDPWFSAARLSLLDRGVIYALAHIRGGSDLGRAWYEDGKMLKKLNTFQDFIACGEYLIKENYTRKDKLFGAGGSAGGLLIGAVINMRPDLFKGAIAAVPFVDVITTMMDKDIPLTTGEYDEWGNPAKPEYYEYILSYSPYDNVRAMAYPHLLITSGLHDSQVQYWEPTKWVARLREMKTDDHRLLLHTNMDAGHSGASGRFRQYKEVALEYAFLLDLVKLKK